MTYTTKILEIAQKIFKDETIKEISALHDAEGYTSMEHVQFLLELETVFNVEIADVELLRNHTIKEVAAMIEKKVENRG